MGAIAWIQEINFPTTLNPGDLITGSITIKNIGDETTGTEAGYFSVLITTLWDGKEYPQIAYSSTKPGETFIFSFHSNYPVGTMPDGDAELVIEGRIWLGYNGGYRIDDTKSWMITIEEVPPPPDLVPLLKIIGSLLTGIVLVGLCLIEPGR